MIILAPFRADPRGFEYLLTVSGAYTSVGALNLPTQLPCVPSQVQ